MDYTRIFDFLTGFRYFSYQAATQLSSRGWVDLFQTLYSQDNFQGAAENRTQELWDDRDANDYPIEVIIPSILQIKNKLIFRKCFKKTENKIERRLTLSQSLQVGLLSLTRH